MLQIEELMTEKLETRRFSILILYSDTAFPSW